MKTIFLLLFSSAIGSTCTCKAQNFQLFGDRAFGVIGSNNQPGILKFSEQKIIISAAAPNVVSGDKTAVNCGQNHTDAWVLMVDTGMNILWDETYGGSDIDYAPLSILLNNHQQIVFSTTSKSDSSCEKSEDDWGQTNPRYDAWICAIDSNGIKVWDKRFGSYESEDNAIVMQDFEGNYLMVTCTFDTASGDRTLNTYGMFDYWLIKFDSSRNIIWQTMLGGSGDERHGNSVLYSPVLHQLSDSSVLLVGNTSSPLSGTISTQSYGGGGDGWMAKIDYNGNIIWDKRFGGSSGFELMCGVLNTASGGFIMSGATNSPLSGTVSQPPVGNTGVPNHDVWVICYDSAGNKLWDRRYGGLANDIGMDIKPAPDGGYLILASTDSDIGYDISEPSYGNGDYWLFKIDSLGNKIWDKRFGGPGDDFAYDMIVMEDSSVFLFGTGGPGVSVIKTDGGHGSIDLWLVHFSYLSTPVSVTEIQNSPIQLGVYPNPSSGSFTLTCPLQGRGTLSVYNAMGQLIRAENYTFQSRNEVPLQQHPPGMYLIRAEVGDRTGMVSVIKQ